MLWNTVRVFAFGMTQKAEGMRKEEEGEERMMSRRGEGRGGREEWGERGTKRGRGEGMETGRNNRTFTKE